MQDNGIKKGLLNDTLSQDENEETGQNSEKSSRSQYNEQQIKKVNQNRIIYIAIIFLLLYTVFYPCQNLSSITLKKFGYGNLGFQSLMVTFFSASIFYLNSPYLLYKLKLNFKWQFLISSILFFMLMLGRRFAIYCAENSSTTGVCSSIIISSILLGGSVFQGFALGMLWVGQRVYIDQCCTPTDKGSLTSLFFVIYQGAFALGPTLATFISGNFSVGIFFDVSVAGMFLVCVMCVFLKDPVPYNKEDNIPQENTKNNTKPVTPLHVLKFLIKKKVLLYWPLLFSPGGIQGVAFATQPLIAMLTIDSNDPNYIAQQLSLQLILMGLAQVTGAKIFGYLLDNFGKRVGANIVGFFNLAYTTTLISCMYFRSFYLLLVMNMFAGFSDCTNSILLSIAMSKFKKQQVEAQATALFISFIGRVIYIVLGVYINSEYALFSLIGLVAILSFSVIVSNHVLKNEQEKLLVVTSNRPSEDENYSK